MTAEKAPAKINSMRSFLNGPQIREQIERALPSLCSPDRFLRIATTTLNKTPKLADCSQESFVNCLLTLAQLGLEPDGRLAHLIPYGNQCTLVIDYKGIVCLVMRSGLVSHLHADVVCENDKFTYKNGRVDHEIDFRNPRGEIYAAYCVCQLKDGSEKHEVMSMQDLEQVRAASKSGNAGPWQKWASEMYKKSVFKRLSKWLPWENDSIRDALDKDEDFIQPEKEVHTAYIPAASPVTKGTSRVEQMKQKYIAPQPIVDIETGEISLVDSLKTRLLDSQSTDKLWETMDFIRTSELTEEEKKTLESLSIAKERELEAR